MTTKRSKPAKPSTKRSKAKPTKPEQPKPLATKPIAAKPPTKVSRVIALAERGTTLDAIMAALQISKAAARSLIGGARAKGIKITRDADGRYKVAK